MAGNLTNIGEELALNMLFRDTGTMPSSIELGLATNDIDSSALGDESTFSDVTEEDDEGYAKQEVTFTSPEQVDGKATIENNAQLEFGPWSEDADNAITYAFLVDNNDNLLGVFELPSEKQPLAGESIIITEGNCVFNLD